MVRARARATLPALCMTCRSGIFVEADLRAFCSHLAVPAAVCFTALRVLLHWSWAGSNPFSINCSLQVALGMPFNNNPILEATDFEAPAAVDNAGVVNGISTRYPSVVRTATVLNNAASVPCKHGL